MPDLQANDSVEYRLVPQFPAYRVGTDGSVWSCWSRGRGPKRITDKWRRLLAGKLKSGHRFAILYPGDCVKGSPFRIGRLVLLVFTGPCPAGMEACHNDGNAGNDDWSNLRWDTHVENIRDKVVHGTRNTGERHGNSQLTDDRIPVIRDKFKNGISITVIAEEEGRSLWCIQRVVYGRGWTHIPGEPYPVPSRKWNRMTASMGAIAISRVAAGETRTQVAIDLGVSLQSVCDTINGIRKRPLPVS